MRRRSTRCRSRTASCACVTSKRSPSRPDRRSRWRPARSTSCSLSEATAEARRHRPTGIHNGGWHRNEGIDTRRPTGAKGVSTMNGASFRRALRVATLCAVAALAACGWSENKPKFQASDITGVDWGKDFHLVDVNGTSRSLAHYRGKVVMVFFGYTNCPDACPTTLAKMAQAVDRLGADGQRVQGL